MNARLSITACLASALSLAACQDRPSGPLTPFPPLADASASDARTLDASLRDAADPDASDAMGPMGPDAATCGMLFTGTYQDWDATPMNPAGIAQAAVIDIDDPANTATTDADGGVSLCLPAARTVLDITRSGYLDLRYTAVPTSLPLPVVARGLQPFRADDLFALELGISRDLQAALVTVSVRSHPGGDPVIGATVLLGNGHAGAYTADGTGVFGPSDTLVDGPLVLFANVAMEGGTTTVQVMAPGGVVCQGPATIDLRAGALAATEFVCSTM